MGGVMRPVGPESAETYWMRRALVVGAFLVLLIILLIVLFNLGGSPGQAAPAPTQSAVPAGVSTSPTPSPSPSAPTGTPATPSPSASPSAATGSASPSASASPSTSSSPSPPSKASKSPSDKSSDKASAKASPSATPVTACSSDDLTPTVRSKKHTVKVGSSVTFDVSYTNKSDQPCSVSVSPDDYQLTIYSGTDRIWSTEDCAKLVHSAKVTLKPGHAVGWSITWNGKRSQQGASCQNRPETPRAGYYHATSQLKGTPSQDYLLILS